MTTEEVMAVSRRGVNRVRRAAASGALKAQPRPPRGRLLFTEQSVVDWIEQGCPEMPASRNKSRLRVAGRVSSGHE
ncbi:helix-turn-helix domain-containing protein [Rhodococcus ruber]|uniref:helix-turn-helix domain-containing protein n=1 Tax=Rhodococcus ruber TaxID=1830 RepID=UPI003B75C636